MFWILSVSELVTCYTIMIIGLSDIIIYFNFFLADIPDNCFSIWLLLYSNFGTHALETRWFKTCMFFYFWIGTLKIVFLVQQWRLEDLNLPPLEWKAMLITDEVNSLWQEQQRESEPYILFPLFVLLMSIISVIFTHALNNGVKNTRNLLLVHWSSVAGDLILFHQF